MSQQEIAEFKQERHQALTDALHGETACGVSLAPRGRTLVTAPATATGVCPRCGAVMRHDRRQRVAWVVIVAVRVSCLGGCGELEAIFQEE